MNKLKSNLMIFKFKILRGINNLIFRLSCKEKQNWLIEKNAYLFFGLQNRGSKLDELGCVVESMTVSGESYKYLGRFCDYCKIVGVSDDDVGKKLKSYKY